MMSFKMKRLLITLFLILLACFLIKRELIQDDYDTEPVNLIKPAEVWSLNLINFNNLDKNYFVSGDQKNCNDAEILFTVITSPDDYERRQAARQTWIRSLPDRTAVKFVIGAVTDKDAEYDLTVEQDKFHDLIRYDMHDHYERLVLKTFVSLNWAKRFCRSLKTVVKIDVDVLPNIPNLIPTIHKHMKSTDLAVLGELRINQPVMRWPDKCYINRMDFSGSVLPPFCRGATYVFTKAALDLIFVNTNNFRIFRAEDVFFTAMMTAGLNITQLDSQNFCGNLNNKKIPFDDSLSHCELTAVEMDTLHRANLQPESPH